MSAFQKNDWVEKLDDAGKSLGNAYVFYIGADGLPVVCHEAKPASWSPDRLALIRRSASHPLTQKKKL